MLVAHDFSFFQALHGEFAFNSGLNIGKIPRQKKRINPVDFLEGLNCRTKPTQG